MAIYLSSFDFDFHKNQNESVVFQESQVTKRVCNLGNKNKKNQIYIWTDIFQLCS